METKVAFSKKLVYITPSKLPTNLLESMITYCDSLHYTDGEVMTNGEYNNSHIDKKSRNSLTSFIPWDEWIPGILYNMMISANEAYFKYDLTYFDSKVQSTIYKSDGNQHYTWHVDGANPYEYNGKLHERKLSCSFLLSDPEEYSGGELQFSLPSVKTTTSKPPKGSAIIFPSWLPHRVRPVKSGIRRSLVVWMQGPCFK